jgi:hypothetical protein
LAIGKKEEILIKTERGLIKRSKGPIKLFGDVFE